MTPAARLAAAIEVLDEIAAAPKAPADRVLEGYVRRRRFIGAKDRHAISERVFGVLRRQARLDWWRGRVRGTAAAGARGRVIADLMLADGKTFDGIGPLFGGGSYAPKPLSSAEAGWARSLEGAGLDHAEMPESVRAECPEWLAPRLKLAFGDDFVAELRALELPAPLDLRVNPLKAPDRDAVRQALAAEGVDAEPTPWSPLGLRVRGRPAVERLTPFRDGRVEVQDEGSQLVARLVGARPGMRVMDYCAGAGGKTLALAADMLNTGRLVACDVSAKRLQRAKLRFRRAGVHNVECREPEADGRWLKRHAASFERVLVDAPCSGTGTWRRNPDARWRYVESDIEELTAVQDSILDAAAKLTACGGRFLYATCSFLRDENEARVTAFLGRHRDYRLVPARTAWTETMGLPPPFDVDDGYLHLTPHRHGTDGFFLATMERVAP
jgi:16S rRNA (cytosine967-C5)-methyltransferase